MFFRPIFLPAALLCSSLVCLPGPDAAWAEPPPAGKPAATAVALPPAPAQPGRAATPHQAAAELAAIQPTIIRPAASQPASQSASQSATGQPTAGQPAPLFPSAPVQPDSGYAARRARYIAAINAAAERLNLPPAVADAVATVESAYNPAAIGADGEVGLMQVMPSTAAMLGFRGTEMELATPETNIQYGVTYLARAWALADGNLCRTFMKYRAGHGEEAMTPLSVEYCRRALLHLASLGSPLATGPNAVIPPPNAPGLPTVIGPRITGTPLTGSEMIRLRRGQRTEADSRRYWEAQEARIRAMRARLQLVSARRVQR